MPNNLYYDMFSQFGDRLNEGIREGQRMQAFSGGIPMTPDGAVDYQKLAAIFMQTGDRASALAVTRLAEAQAENRGTAAYRQQTLDLQRQQLGETARQHTETTKLGRERLAAEVAIAGGKPPEVIETFDAEGLPQKQQWDRAAQKWVPLGGPKSRMQDKVGAAEIKQIFDIDAEMPNLNATIRDLGEASKLAPDAFEGPWSAQRGRIGSWNLPIINEAIDPEKAKKTSRLNSILSLESVTRMADTLVGASTDREMGEFKRILADPDQPAELKQQTIQTMLIRAEEKRQMLVAQKQAIRTGEYRRTLPPPAPGEVPGAPGEVPPVPPPGPPGTTIAPFTGDPANIGRAQPPPGAVPPPPGGPTRSLPAQGGPPAPNAARQRIGATFGGPMPQSAPQPDVERIQRMGEAMEAAGMPPEIIAERLRQAFGIGGQRGTPSPAPPPGSMPPPSGPQGYGPVAAQSQVPVPQMMPPQAPPPGPVPSFAGQPLGQAPGTPPGAQPPPWLPQPPRPVPQPLPTQPMPPPQLLY